MPGKPSFFSRNLKNKLVLLALLLVMALYFTNDFGLVDVEKTAIIVAAGVDRTPGGYELSCQLVRPEDGGGYGQVVVFAEGGTVAECMSAMQSRTGWHPKLSFCNLVVLGETALEEDVMQPLQFFLRTEQFNDSALLVACKDTAKTFLSEKTPLDPLSATGIGKILDKDNRRVTDVLSVNLKDFALGYYSASDSLALPVISALSLESDAPAQAGGSKAAEGEAKDVVYDATELAILRRGVKTVQLSGDMTKAYNLVKTRYTKGSWEIPESGNQAPFSVEIDKKRVKERVSLAGGGIEYRLEITLYVHIIDRPQLSAPSDLAKNDELDAGQRQRVKESVENGVRRLFSAAIAAKSDFLGLGDRLYKYETSAWKRYLTGLSSQEDYLGGAKLELTVRIK